MSDTYEFACTHLRETDNAVQVEDDIHGKLWIPLSSVESMHFNQRGEGSIVVTRWIAREKGLL